MVARALYALPILPAFSSSNYSRANRSSLSLHRDFKQDDLVSSMIGNVTALRSSTNSMTLVQRHQRSSVATTVFFMLPTLKPDRAPADRIPNWSARSIKAFGMAELEARKLKYPTTGTESLLMGILVEGTSLAAKILRENGITLFKVREETVKLLGKSDLYFFSPEHPPLTEPAQRALDWAVDEKMKSGEAGEITATHLLLGIWSEKDTAGHEIMAAFGFDDEKAKELAKSMNEDAVMTYR